MQYTAIMNKILTALTLMLAAGLAGCSKDDGTNVPITGISIAETKTVQIGQTVQLTVTVMPENATEKPDFAWSSSDSGVATVDESGNVTAHSTGNAVITVRLRSNEAVQATCTVTGSEETAEYDPDEVVEFEDSKFQALTLYYDKNNDGKLQAWEAALVTELELSGQSIKSLRGIEYFTELESLNCTSNLLTSLDVTNNRKLRALWCKSNRIVSLDVTPLRDLQILNCESNRLTSLDVSQNTELVHLLCGMNNGATTDDDGITIIDVSNNPKLETLSIYYLNISELDVTNNPSLKKLDFGMCCHTRWGDLTPIEHIDLSRNPELEELNCASSNYPGFGLDELDVSNNPKLKRLTTYGNPKLGSLDLSRNPELKTLNCCHNSLSALDVTKCPKIDTLYCAYNEIGTLDLTQSAELVWINCQNNRIDKLDVSNTKIGYLMAPDNRIASVNMGDKTFDTPSPSGSGYEDAGLPYLYINLNNNQLTDIDLSKQKYLYWLEISGNRLTSLDLTGCSKVGGVLCGDNSLTSLVLDGCTRLWELRFANNGLSGELDLSPFSLTRIASEGNRLETIYVPQDFDPDATYFMGGVGTLPCYTKDAETDWVKK